MTLNVCVVVFCHDYVGRNISALMFWAGVITQKIYTVVLWFGT
jgi:hypothetical protein